MKCKPSKCPPQMCAMYCENGFKKDENGCDKCECEECSQLMCMIECEYGFKKDENGCDKCECEECSQLMCMIECEYGFKKDENGCDKCECHECSELMCMMHCEYGFEQDEHGCNICKCKEVMYPSCRPDNENNGYQYTQCAVFGVDTLCWCVAKIGAYISGTVSYGNVKCDSNGKVPDANNGEPFVCDNGARVVLQTEPCRDVMCKPGVQCWMDPCSGGARTMMITDERKQTYDIDTAYSMELCKQRDLLCPSESYIDVCHDTCDVAMCPGFPEARCVIDYCNCVPYFVDMYSNKRVLCQAVGGVCSRKQAKMQFAAVVKSVAISELEALSDKRLASTPQCNEIGEYKSQQCDGAICWCVHHDGTPSKRKAPCPLEVIKLFTVRLVLKASSNMVTASDVKRQIADMMYVKHSNIEMKILSRKRRAADENVTEMRVQVNMEEEHMAASKVALITDYLAEANPPVLNIKGKQVTIMESEVNTRVTEIEEEDDTKIGSNDGETAASTGTMMSDTTKWVLIGVAAFVAFCVLLITCAVLFRTCKGRSSAKYSPPVSANSSIRNMKMSFNKEGEYNAKPVV